LHEKTNIHQGISSYSVLLFDNDVAKIADFDFNEIAKYIAFMETLSVDSARFLLSSDGHRAPERELNGSDKEAERVMYTVLGRCF
jgi:hypothetical protein